MALSRFGGGMVCLAVLAVLFLTPTVHAALTPSVVLYANRGSVDSDGDLTPDIYDNAPGVANDQQDSDADGIGDVIDPTLATSNPYLGDPGLALFSPAPIAAGSHLLISYTMILGTPPGGWGHIDLDFGGDSSIDATYFGPLDAATDVMDIDPSLYVGANWDLNTPGTYTLFARAYGPGMSSQNDSILTDIVVTPEPGSLLLSGCAVLLLYRRGKREGGI